VRKLDSASRSPHAALSAYLAIGLVAVAAALSSYPFIAPGHPYTVDTWPHLARQSIVYHAIKEGFSPFYTFMYYCGFPALRFYSPLFSFLGGPLTLLTGGNLLLALRILLVALHLVSALAMYLYLRRSEAQGKKKGEGAGFGPALGAIVYLVIPWRVLYLSIIANYPQALVYVLLPLIFLALENVLRTRREERSKTRNAAGTPAGLMGRPAVSRPPRVCRLRPSVSRGVVGYAGKAGDRSVADTGYGDAGRHRSIGLLPRPVCG